MKTEEANRARVRARTISIKRLPKRELERGRKLYPETDYDRPKTRADCLHGPHAERPCPFVSCKHHLYLDVNERNGSIKVNFPDVEVWELSETCALDVADREGITLEEIGAVMNVTREGIRQIETKGLEKLRALKELADLTNADLTDADLWYGNLRGADLRRADLTDALFDEGAVPRAAAERARVRGVDR